MDTVVISEKFKAQCKAHIRSKMQPYFSEFEEIKALQGSPDLTVDFLIGWIENFKGSLELLIKE